MKLEFKLGSGQAATKKTTSKKVSSQKGKSDTLSGSGSLTIVFTAATKATEKTTDKNVKTESKKAAKPKVLVLSTNPSFKQAAQKLIDAKVIHGKCGETYHYRDALGEGSHLVTLGLGEKIDGEAFRRAGAQISKIAKGSKEATLVVGALPKNAVHWAQAFTEGAHLGGYNFQELKSDKKDEEEATIYIQLEAKGSGKSIDADLKTGATLAECINFSRRLGDLPGNLMTPEILAEEVHAAAKGTGLKVSIWDKARIKKEKMGCLLGVSLGSAAEPRFIVMEYHGAGKSKKPVCFVGKGLTFDSGGISIKPSANMEEMKYDMCGGANTIGTLLAIARLKLKVNVIGLVPSSENMPGPLANKPGDILVARNGKTIEVNNTDAEGRLILADALSYANELKPAFIVDSATLTGAMVMALGDTHVGYFAKNEKLAKALEVAAAQTGERIWRMPLIEEHKDDMKGVYADLNNISSNRGAGSAHGAAFLEFFVDTETIPWVHVDIAGTAYHTGHRLPYNPKRGANGVMIRTYVELAKAWS